MPWHKDQRISSAYSLAGKRATLRQQSPLDKYLTTSTAKARGNPPKASNEPYAVTIDVRENRPYQDSGIFQTKVLAFWIHCGGGKPGSKKGIEVLKTQKKDEKSEGKYFIVFTCPDLYFQVEPISFFAPFEGLK